MSFTLTQLLVAKIGLCVGGIGLAAWYTFHVARTGRHRRLFHALAGLLALLGVASYHDFGNFGFVGYWDLYHYYLGSKYSHEVGWHDLYNASVVADAEGGRVFRRIEKIRDNRTQRIIAVRKVLEQRERYKALFSEPRWQEFKQDLGFFQRRLSPKTWEKILRDRGYNPSPVWDRVGSLITSRLPLSDPWTISALVWLDRLLMMAALATILWAYGLPVMLLFLVAWGCNPLHMIPVKGAFLRLDWLAALLAGAACFKKEKHLLAGVLLAYSAMVRVFPLVFLGGLLLRAGWELVEARRVLPWARRFFLGFSLSALVLAAAGSFDSANRFDLGRWQQFKEKIDVHSAVHSIQRSGLEYLVGWHQHTSLRWAAGLLLLAGFAWAARRMERDRLLPAGFVALFVFVSPASYYFCLASLIVLLFHGLERKADLLGLASLLCAYAATALVTLHYGVTKHLNIAWTWSWCLLGLALVTIARFALPLRLEEASPEAAGVKQCAPSPPPVAAPRPRASSPAPVRAARGQGGRRGGGRGGKSR